MGDIPPQAERGLPGSERVTQRGHPRTDPEVLPRPPRWTQEAPPEAARGGREGRGGGTLLDLAGPLAGRGRTPLSLPPVGRFQIFDCSRLKFSEIPQRLTNLLLPPDPIVINHIIRSACSGEGPPRVRSVRAPREQIRSA